MKVLYDDDLLSLADYDEAIEFEDDDAVVLGLYTIADEANADEVE